MHTDIKTVKTWPDKTPVASIQLHIAKVFPGKKITTKYGEKHVQGFYGKDATGEEIKVDVWDHEDISQYEGQDVVISSGAKGSGVTVSHDSYKGKSEIKLSVGRAAQFQPITAGTPIPSRLSPSEQGAGIQTPPGNQNPVKGKAEASNEADKFHAGMKKMALFYVHCEDYARKIVDKVGEKDNQQFQAIVSTLFIEGNKRGLAADVPAYKPTLSTDAPQAIDNRPVTPTPSVPQVSAPVAKAEDDEIPF